MLVSVLIPAYNAENTIVETLDSVINQNTATEIIVVNDGSTDFTLNILKSYNERIHIINTINRGVSHARNLAFSHARGKYIQYLDADDLLGPDKLINQIKFLENSKADIAFGNFQRFKVINDQQELTKLETPSISGLPEVAAFTSFWCPPAALLYRREIAQKITWNENLPIIQDARYILDAAIEQAKFVYTPGIMAYYREGQVNSLSQQSKLKFYKDCLTNAIEIHEIWENDYHIQPEKKQAILHVIVDCIYEFSLLNSSLHHLAISTLLKIEPNYQYQGNKLLMILSNIIGYKKSEYLASLIRNKVRK